MHTEGTHGWYFEGFALCQLQVACMLPVFSSHCHGNRLLGAVNEDRVDLQGEVTPICTTVTAVTAHLDPVYTKERVESLCIYYRESTTVKALKINNQTMQKSWSKFWPAVGAVTRNL